MIFLLYAVSHLVAMPWHSKSYPRPPPSRGPRPPPPPYPPPKAPKPPPPTAKRPAIAHSTVVKLITWSAVAGRLLTEDRRLWLYRQRAAALEMHARRQRLLSQLSKLFGLMVMEVQAQALRDRARFVDTFFDGRYEDSEDSGDGNGPGDLDTLD